ncbi:MAG: phosphate signaling complex protein PhoU [Thermomicrobia bacterium]|nr:phosphate signaling complex protein PhoU [Thermomicrobia bacterium]
MPRIALDRGLNDLHADVLTLASMVEKSIQRSVEALRTRDASVARRVIEDDARVNTLRFQIEDKALLLIATQQPLVHDLRTIAAVLNIITDLERMGDHAEGTATISLMIGDEPLLKPLLDIPRMAETVTDMLRRALLAFTDHDVVSARNVAAEDDAVDALYNQVYRELLTFMIGDPRTIRQATLLLWAAHNLERIGDRVTNICERVLFTETGRMQEIRPTGALKMEGELR